MSAPLPSDLLACVRILDVVRAHGTDEQAAAALSVAERVEDLARVTLQNHGAWDVKEIAAALELAQDYVINGADDPDAFAAILEMACGIVVQPVEAYLASVTAPAANP